MSNNILVNWKVNTDDVAKSRDLLNQANTAANKFQQTAKDGAKTSKDALGQLVAEEKRLETAIKSTTRTSFTSYAAFTKQLQGLSRQYSDVKIKVEQATKAINEQNKAQQDLNKNTASLNKTYGQLGTAIGAIFTVAALRQMVNWTLETARLAGNVEGVERAFNRAIPNATLLLDGLRDSTQGTIGDFELMKQTLQAKNFGLPVEKLGKLLEFATVKAQQTGLSIDYITNSLVTGLGRKSERVFDNLQLDIAELRKRIASGLDFREAGIQLIEEDLERMGGSITTAATRVDRLTSSTDNLKASLAQLIVTAGSGNITGGKGIFDFLTEGINGLNDIVKGKSLSQGLIDQSAIDNVQLFMKELGPDSAKNIEIVQQKLNSTIQVIGRYNDMIREARAEVDLMKGFGLRGFDEENQAGVKRYTELVQQYGNRAREVFEKENETARARLKAFETSKAVLIATIPLLKEFLSTLNLTDPVVSQLGLIEAKLEEIEAKELEIKTAKSEQAIHDLTVQLGKLNGELADLQALGTTKRQLVVNGQLKLVPVLAPKGSEKTLSSTKTIDFADQLQEMVDNMMITGVINFKTGKFNISEQAKPTEIIPMDEWDKIGQEFADNWQNILGQGLNDTTSFLDSVLQAEADTFDQRLNQNRQYYDRLMILAGDNEKAKDRLRLREQKEENKLRREAFEADKRAKRSSAVINGAAGIVNAFATLPYPAAIVAAVLIAAETAAQIAVINRQQPRFAKGVIDLKGPGTKTSDSIPAKLSKGESVMTADETGSARGILNDIRAGKLNDRKLAKQLDSAVLRDLKITKDGVKMVGMDDSRIVKKLDQLMNAQPDYMEKSGILFKTRQKSENYKQWVRAKIM